MHVRPEHAVHQEAGRVLHRQRQLVDVAHERGRFLRQLADRVFARSTTSTSCSSGTGLKKWMPTSRDGSFSAVAMSASLRLEVLVARIASGFAIDSSLANSARFASRFSKIASISTSAWRAPAPLYVGDQAIERVAHAARIAQAALEQLRGALHRGREALGCGVLQRDAQAAHARTSRRCRRPSRRRRPRARARRERTPLATDFSRSCRKKMRIRFDVVGCSNSDSIEHAGSLAAANGSPSYFFHSSRIA